MKRIGLMLVFALLLGAQSSFAQESSNPFQEFVDQNQEEIASGYADPFVQAFGTGVTGGLFRTADTHSTLGFDIGLRAMLVIIPEGKSTVLDSADVSLFPVPVVQAAVGLPLGFEATLRGFGAKYEDASVSLFGIGLKKKVSSYIPIPMFPDVSAMVTYHKFKATYTTFELSSQDFTGSGTSYNVISEIDASDIINSSHWSFDLVASKKFSLLIFSVQPYVGFGIDKSAMTFKWTTTITETDPPNVPGVAYNTPMPVEETFSVTTTRLTLGLDISPFPFVHVFGDYNISKFPQATAGLAISIR